MSPQGALWIALLWVILAGVLMFLAGLVAERPGHRRYWSLLLGACLCYLSAFAWIARVVSGTG